jgi:tetratricopeptide (TPR) repeat protein
MGRYAEALADLDRAIGLQPDDAWAIARRGEAYRLMGRYAEALADLDRAIGLQPDDAWAIASRGETYRLMGRYAEALADLERAIGLQPDYAWAIARRGEAYRLMGRYAEALADLERAGQIWPESNWVVYQIGLCRLALGQPQQAADCFTRAIERAQVTLAAEPADPITRFNLALYLLVTGQTEAARQAYHDALALNPSLPRLRDARQDLADLQAQVGDLPGLHEAIGWLDHAMRTESAGQ